MIIVKKFTFLLLFATQTAIAQNDLDYFPLAGKVKSVETYFHNKNNIEEKKIIERRKINENNKLIESIEFSYDRERYQDRFDKQVQKKIIKYINSDTIITYSCNCEDVDTTLLKKITLKYLPVKNTSHTKILTNEPVIPTTTEINIKTVNKKLQPLTDKYYSTDGSIIKLIKRRYNQNKLIHLEEIYAEGETSFTEEYTYNDKGNVSQSYKVEFLSNNYTREEKLIFEYNKKGLLIEDKEYNGKNPDCILKKSYTYNQKNDLLEIQYISKEGELYTRKVYTYEANGTIKSITLMRNKDGSIINKTEFEYDKNKNWITQISSNTYRDNKATEIYTFTRKISYY